MTKIYLWIYFLLSAAVFVSACHPRQNSNSEEIVFQKELGRYLFYEKRLSVTETKSCASCHDPALAFADGYRRAPGVYADLHFRNTPSLVNISYQRFFNWANPEIQSLEAQMNMPLFGRTPIEMGLDSTQTHVLQLLLLDKQYKNLLEKAFPNRSDSLTWDQVKISLGKFVGSITSFDAPYDRYKKGNEAAISESAKKGEKLFFSAQLQCFSCHVPPTFGADSSRQQGDQFVNIGLYNYSLHKDLDSGLHLSTGNEQDRGKFKIPSLRNLAQTGPYFHDGSGSTLEEVLQVYIEGGREVKFGSYQGDGRSDPNKHYLMRGANLSKQEKQQLIDFLDTLNDTQISSRAELQSPF